MESRRRVAFPAFCCSISAARQRAWVKAWREFRSWRSATRQGRHEGDLVVPQSESLSEFSSQKDKDDRFAYILLRTGPASSLAVQASNGHRLRLVAMPNALMGAPALLHDVLGLALDFVPASCFASLLGFPSASTKSGTTYYPEKKACRASSRMPPECASSGAWPFACSTCMGAELRREGMCQAKQTKQATHCICFGGLLLRLASPCAVETPKEGQRQAKLGSCSCLPICRAACFIQSCSDMSTADKAHDRWPFC